MNSYTIYGLLAVLVLVFAGLSLYLYKNPKARKELVTEGEKIEKEVEKVLPIADKTIDAVEKVMPNTPIANVLEEIRQLSQVGAKYAQQMYKTEQLTAGQRFDAAEAIVTTGLTKLGFDIDEKSASLIKASIESAVNDLPSIPKDVKEIRDELEKAKSDLLNSQTSAKQLEDDKTAVLTQLEEVKKQKDDALAQLNAIKGAVKGIQDTTPVETTTQATPVAEQPTIPVQ